MSTTLHPSIEVASFSRPKLPLQWPRSIIANLLIAALFGFTYAVLVLGLPRLNTSEISWLGGDAVSPFLAWGFFRNDPHLHWPLTFTKDINYPIGDSVALMDPNPLLLLVFKVLSPILPVPFQFLGWAAVIACTLQFFFASRLFIILLGRNVLEVLLPSLFFLIAPPLTWRLSGHFSLISHWVIVAALVIVSWVIRTNNFNLGKLSLYCGSLGAAAVGVNPYLAFMVVLLLTAAVGSALLMHRINWKGALTALLLTAAACLISASAFGFLRAGGGFTALGYRDYSMNLLAPWDSGVAPYDSIILRALPKFGAQYEGYNYLGVGVIVLSVTLLPGLRKLRQVSWGRIYARMPLLVCCSLLTILALSTKVTFGSSILVDWDPSQRLTPYLSIFRASGRLFWPTYYVVVAGILTATFRLWGSKSAVLLAAIALILQLCDTQPLRRWVRETASHSYPMPLHAPLWSSIGKSHRNLIVLPAYQCAAVDSPGGADSYRIFGLLASSQNMRTNSYYASRYRSDDLKYQCNTVISDLSTKRLDPASAYVVTPILAQQIAEGPTGPGKCRFVDRFVLCSTQTDFGLGPGVMNPAERLRNAIADAGFENDGLSDWPSWLNVTANVGTGHARSGVHSLAESLGTGADRAAGSVYQDVTGLQPGQAYTVSAWVSASSGATAAGQLAVYDVGSRLATYSNPLIPTSKWNLVTHTVTVKAPGTLRIHLFRNAGSGTIFWDDIRIYRDR